MPGLKEIPSGAYLAWSPTPRHKSVLALVRREQAIIDFVDIKISDPSRNAFENLVSLTCQENVSIGALGWSGLFPELEAFAPSGLLAAGFNNGAVKVWNPDELLRDRTETDAVSTLNESTGLLTKIQIHCQPVTCLEFSSNSCAQIACGHDDGVLNLLNLSNPEHPDIYEAEASSNSQYISSTICSPDPMKRVTALAWNRSVQNILATTTSDGVTTVWNVKQRKQAITFKDPANRFSPSSVAWVPNQPTQVVVTYDDDINPSLQMWDLRNSSYPFRDFSGHNRGILSIRVSEVDSSLMLTCGKDNRTVCWAFEDQQPSIYSETVNSDWQTDIRWSPCLPGLFGSISHEEGGITIDSVQHRRNPSTKYIPGWFQKPCGVAFGFGGKLASFSKLVPTGVQVSVVPSTEVDLVAQADEFEYTLVSNDYHGYCQKKIQAATDDHDKLTWEVVQTLFYPPEVRSSVLLDRLGYKAQTVAQEVERYFGHRPGAILEGAAQIVEDLRSVPAAESITQNPPVDAASFFQELCDTTAPYEKSSTDGVLDAFVQSVPVAPVKPVPAGLEARNWETLPDLMIKNAFLVGQRALAIELCLESGRWADALLLAATSNDNTLWIKTKSVYIQRRSHDKFFQMIAAVTAQKWDDLVKLAELSRWEESLALLASYVPAERFSSLCEALGVRLESEMFDIRAAVVCYLAAGSFSRASQIWSTLAVSGNRGKSLQRGLQDLVEKLTVLKKATNFQGDDGLFNQKVSQYAEILANSGRLVAGMKLLCLVDTADTTGKNASEILRHRIYNSSPESMRNAGIPLPAGLPFNQVSVRAAYPLRTFEDIRNASQISALPTQQTGAWRPYPPSRPGVRPVNQQNAFPTSLNQQQWEQPRQTPWQHDPARSVRPPAAAGRQHAPLPTTTSFQGQQALPATASYQGPPPLPAGHQGPPLVPPFQGNLAPPVPSATPLYPTQSINTNAAKPSVSAYAPSLTAYNPAQDTAKLEAKAPYRPEMYPPFKSDMAAPNRSDITPAYRAETQPVPRIEPSPVFRSEATHSYRPEVQPGFSTNLPHVFRPEVPFVPVPETPPTFKTEAPLAYKPEQSSAYKPESSPFYRPTLPPAYKMEVHAPYKPEAPFASRPDQFRKEQSSTYYPHGSTQQMGRPPTADVMSLMKSTAPTAGVSRIPPGMPVPWPIPTETQQVASTTQATAPANQKIHAVLDGTQSEGVPMNPADLATVKRVLMQSLDIQIQNEPHNTRKHEDIRNKLEDLINQLRSGACPTKTQEEVLHFCKVLQAGDSSMANTILATMLRTSWTKESRNWLTALKRILTK